MGQNGHVQFNRKKKRINRRWQVISRDFLEECSTPRPDGRGGSFKLRNLIGPPVREGDSVSRDVGYHKQRSPPRMNRNLRCVWRGRAAPSAREKRCERGPHDRGQDKTGVENILPYPSISVKASRERKSGSDLFREIRMA